MSIYAIGDLHLSITGEYSMEVFPGWADYIARIREHWLAAIKPDDTVVLAGDTSWGMSLEGALADFQFLEQLPGRKILLKGNHDYWWSTRRKMETFFAQHALDSFLLLHNNYIEAEGAALCGSRGWLIETADTFDAKIVQREAMRLDTSISLAKTSGMEPVAFLHYPPVYGQSRSDEIMEVLHRHDIRECYYGHIHAAGCKHAVQGVYEGIRLRMISSDYLDFRPVLVR